MTAYMKTRHMGEYASNFLDGFSNANNNSFFVGGHHFYTHVLFMRIIFTTLYNTVLEMLKHIYKLNKNRVYFVSCITPRRLRSGCGAWFDVPHRDW